MNILNKIWLGIKNFLLSTIYVWISLIISLIVGFIWGTEIGVLTGFGIVLFFILYVWGRQAWWWITKTGDNKND